MNQRNSSTSKNQSGVSSSGFSSGKIKSRFSELDLRRMTKRLVPFSAAGFIFSPRGRAWAKLRICFRWLIGRRAPALQPISHSRHCRNAVKPKGEDRKDKALTLADLRDSGELEQHADAVFGLTRENADRLDVAIMKNRNGPLSRNRQRGFACSRILAGRDLSRILETTTGTAKRT